MIADRLVWIVEGEPDEVVAGIVPDREIVSHVPKNDVWDLAPLRLVWPVTLDSRSTCAAVLDAVLRGVAVVIRVCPELGAASAARFLDDLDRVAARESPAPTACRLDDDQRRLLRALSAGATLRAAAGELCMSNRTASRRLADARRVLGCDTNTEAARLLPIGPADVDDRRAGIAASR